MTVVLARLEGALRALCDDVLHPAESSRLTRYEDPIDPALAESLNQLAAQAQAQIGRMARDLALKAARNPIRRAHLVAFQLLNIDLCSSHPSEELRGYGKVTPATATYLEAELTRLETLTSEIIRVLELSPSD